MSLFTPPGWPAGVRLGATTRGGGASRPPFDSFNLGEHVGDELDDVTANRRRLGRALPAGCELFWMSQVHGVRAVQASIGSQQAPRADACWTRDGQVACVVLTADCLPVLLASDDGALVAAVHAGWRGLAAGVLESAIDAMAVPPAALLAWLGPAIGPGVFEVGPEVREAFLGFGPEASGCFAAGGDSDRLYADLRALACLRLRQLGVVRTQGDSRCTYSHGDSFFSYRRDGRTGRMAFLIFRDAAREARA